MNTLISLNATKFRIPFYNKLVAEHGVRVILIMMRRSERPPTLHPCVEIVQARLLFGTIWPDVRVDFDSTSRIACIFDLRLMPWLIFTGTLKRTLLWGIGKGRLVLGNWLRTLILRRSAGQLSYMPRGILEPYDDGGHERLSMYLVNSVFLKSPASLWGPTRQLAFIGTIDKRKRLDIAIHALRHLLDMGMTWQLEIIGDGPDMSRCREIARRLKVDHLVTWHGRVDVEEEKRKILKGSFLTILPGQAGLSVLESFAYGLPVLSWKNAVSGGEIDMIVNGVTGYTEQRLCPLMLANRIWALSASLQDVEEMSNRCFVTYHATASGEHMLERFVAAFKILEEY